jgi:hypothetical protein
VAKGKNHKSSSSTAFLGAGKGDIQMNPSPGILRRLILLWRADFLSPKDLLKRAVLITIAFLICQYAGLRDFTSVLCGTAGSTELSWKASAALGAAYIVIYLAFVLLVPILLLAAFMLSLWKPSQAHARS